MRTENIAVLNYKGNELSLSCRIDYDIQECRFVTTVMPEPGIKGVQIGSKRVPIQMFAKEYPEAAKFVIEKQLEEMEKYIKSAVNGYGCEYDNAFTENKAGIAQKVLDRVLKSAH